MSEPIKVKRTVPVKHVGKVGLVKDENGNTLYNDSWMHSDIEDGDDGFYEKVNMEKSIYIDLGKSTTVSMPGTKLNRAKLVQRRTAVKGKDGKIYYRMQWVDPNKDFHNPESSPQQTQTETPSPKKPMENTKEFYSTQVEENQSELEPQQNDVAEVLEAQEQSSELKDRVNSYVKSMSKEDTREMMEKFGIELNDNGAITWMKAVMGLKNYLINNPHEIGAEHLPKKPNTTPDGTNSLQDTLNRATRESMYSLIKELGIAEVDPSTVPEWEKSQATRHFNNMMRLRQQLIKNPELIKKLELTNPLSEDKEATIIQKSGHDITTIMNRLSREDKYKLMAKLGINDGTDPRYNPALLASGMASKIHMDNVMALKKMIEKDPSVLKHIDDKMTEVNKPKSKDISEHQKRLEDVRSGMKNASKQFKQTLLYQYRKHPTLINRTKKDNENVDWMHSMMALTEILAESKENYDSFKSDLDKESRATYKFTNKEIEKFLRGMCGIKGETAQVNIAEKGSEWEFGGNGSFVRRNFDEDDNPVLTVVKFNEDGDMDSEEDFDIKDVLDFLEGKQTKHKEDIKPDSVDLSSLHKKPYQDIMAALKKDMNNMTDEVKGVINNMCRDTWKNWTDEQKLAGSLIDVKNIFPTLNKREVMNALRKLGVSCSETHFGSTSENWFRITYPEKFVPGRKVGKSSDYIINIGDKVFTDALHANAKGWSDAERSQSRGEVLEDLTKYSFDESEVMSGSTPEQYHENKAKVNKALNGALSGIPYDLLTDILIKDKLSIVFSKQHKGLAIASYNPGTRQITLDRSYIDSIHQFEKVNPGMPPSHTYSPYGVWHRDYGNNMRSITPPLHSTLLHEFGHALDYFFRDNANMTKNPKWDGHNKYVGGNNRSIIADSFNSAVNRSNKTKSLIRVPLPPDNKGVINHSYILKDEWINSYEGKLYNLSESDVTKNADGTYQLKHMADYSAGDEHWAENFEYVMSLALNMKRMGLEPQKYLEEMANAGYSEAKSKYEDENIDDMDFIKRHDVKPSYIGQLNGDSEQFYKLRAGLVAKKNPKLYNAINKMFIRGDFLDDKVSKSVVELYIGG